MSIQKTRRNKKVYGSSRCVKCGRVFLMGGNGICEPADLCDHCAHAVRAGNNSGVWLPGEKRNDFLWIGNLIASIQRKHAFGKKLGGRRR